ncbi:MAG: TIM barrel protein [Planctomycetota bacterium]|nr:TIM barrel protein [Planctomycetota bacterium]
MSQPARVLLSGFGDESAHSKSAELQFAALAAMGLQYYSLRFIDTGEGVKNVMQLTPPEIHRVLELQAEYGLRVATIGSPIGKVKLLDVEDGTSNRYVPFSTYLKNEVPRVCELAHAFDTNLVRGFSFYHPRGTDLRKCLPQAIEQLGQIAEHCASEGIVFGLEVEANLIGQDGTTLAEIHHQVAHPSLVLVFDAANLLCQGMSTDDVYREYRAMQPGIGWIHIKDYRNPTIVQRQSHVEEEQLRNFVPADRGQCGHEMILRDFRDHLPSLTQTMHDRGIPGVFLDLEPHVKGGGQFGGFSGPDGMGVALRGLCRVLDYVGISYHLRNHDDILAARG